MSIRAPSFFSFSLVNHSTNPSSNLCKNLVVAVARRCASKPDLVDLVDLVDPLVLVVAMAASPSRGSVVRQEVLRLGAVLTTTVITTVLPVVLRAVLRAALHPGPVIAVTATITTATMAAAVVVVMATAMAVAATVVVITTTVVAAATADRTVQPHPRHHLVWPLGTRLLALELVLSLPLRLRRTLATLVATVRRQAWVERLLAFLRRVLRLVRVLAPVWAHPRALPRASTLLSSSTLLELSLPRRLLRVMLLRLPRPATSRPRRPLPERKCTLLNHDNRQERAYFYDFCGNSSVELTKRARFDFVFVFTFRPKDDDETGRSTSGAEYFVVYFAVYFRCLRASKLYSFERQLNG